MARTAPVFGSSATTAPLRVPEGGLGRLLGGPVQGQDQRPAGGLAGGEQVGHVLAELPGARPARNELSSCSARVRPKTSE